MDKNLHDGMRDAMDNKYMPMTSVASGIGQEVIPDIYCYTNQIVNLCFVGSSDKPNDWVLVDTGMPESAERILEEVEGRFGEGSKPKAIILTHGHFDHVGAVVDLVSKWNIPVYAHEVELPYLTGKEQYPDPDGTVEGGMVAKLSPLFPTEPIDLGSHVKALPADGSIPDMPEWRWLHTPGHSPGQVSLFRDSDRSLIAGDAFVTVKQESLYKVMTQTPEVSGPPRYLTTDWHAAKRSVEKLARLQPELVVTGHGIPMTGEELSKGLERLVRDFDDIAVPEYGRFVDREH